MPASATASEWFAAFSTPRVTNLRVVCFPYVGGGTWVFRPWAGAFGDGAEVLSLQLPGRERRMTDALVDSMPALVERIAPFFEEIDTPYVFFGHSMGGLVAFELARELRRRGARLPSVLFASACSAPQIPDYVVPPRSTLGEEGIVNELRRLGGTDEVILANAELRRLFVPALRADFNIVDIYRYYDEEPLDCRIVALGGIHDSGIHFDMLAGWRRQTSRTFGFHMFHGDHFYLHSCRDALLAMLNSELKVT